MLLQEALHAEWKKSGITQKALGSAIGIPGKEVGKRLGKKTGFFSTYQPIADFLGFEFVLEKDSEESPEGRYYLDHPDSNRVSLYPNLDPEMGACVEQSFQGKKTLTIPYVLVALSVCSGVPRYQIAEHLGISAQAFTQQSRMENPTVLPIYRILRAFGYRLVLQEKKRGRRKAGEYPIRFDGGEK